MIYKEKLRELLKTDKEVKEQMEKLEFGCKSKSLIDGKEIILLKNNYIEYETDNGTYNNTNVEIIGLPLQERFLELYLFNKGINYIFNQFHQFCIAEKGNKGVGVYVKVVKIDKSKDFDNQIEEVYQKIFEALYFLTNKNE